MSNSTANPSGQQTRLTSAGKFKVKASASMTKATNPAIVAMARAIYVSLGTERDDPWDACTARREKIGLSPLSANQEACLAHAQAAIEAMPDASLLVECVDGAIGKEIAEAEAIIERTTNHRAAAVQQGRIEAAEAIRAALAKVRDAQPKL